MAALSSIVPGPGVPCVSPPGAVLARPRVVALGGGFFLPPTGWLAMMVGQEEIKQCVSIACDS